MKTQRSLEIKVGAVTLASIILFIVGITLGRGCNVGVNQTEIRMRFPNSGSVVAGSPIVVNGVLRGKVSTVNNNNGSVLITGMMDDISDLKSDVHATVAILEITGGKKIEMNPGKATTLFSPSNEIPGDVAADFAELAAMGGIMAKDAVNLLKRIDTLSGSINKLFSDGNLGNKIITTAEHTEHLINTLDQTFTEKLPQFEILLSNMKTISNDLKEIISNNREKAENLISETSSTITDARGLIKDAKSSLSKIDAFIFETEGLIKDMKTKNSLVGKLLYDEKFARRADSTLASLFSLSEMIRKYGINTNIRIGSNP